MSEHWIDSCGVEDVPPDDVIGMEVAGLDLALYRVGDEVFATDNICTHGHARLCDGFLEGHEIECPLHQGRFDVRSGKAMCEPLTQDIRIYPIKVANGRVYVALPTQT